MSILVRVKIEMRGPISSGRAAKQMVYGVVNAINRTVLQVQGMERRQVAARVTVRRAEFIMREIAKIGRKNFASVARGQAWAEIEIGQKSRLLLSALETGGLREPFKGKEKVALPFIGHEARPSESSQVPEELGFKALAFKKARRGSSKLWVSQEQPSIYMVAGVGVFERTSKGERSTMLWAMFAPFHMPPRLGWRQLAITEGARLLALNLALEAFKENV